MTTTEARVPGDTDSQSPVAAMASPGARLRAAREAAGLSLDQVAQQLKLSQRQVKALEDQNFSELPGRTFSRGFVRNYARLLNLDPDDLLSHLPDVAHAPALGSPALHSTGAMIAELPNTMVPKASISRWMIPLALIGCIIAAAGYEWYRGGLGSQGDAPRTSSAATPAESGSGTGARTSLPNPLASEVRPAASSPSNPVDDKTPPATLPAPNASIGAPATASMQVAAPAPSAPAAPVVADAPLMLTFAGPSWTEVRDRTGQLLVSRLVDANSVEPVRGVPPFDVVLGNAKVVVLSYRGKAIDLAPYTHQNVARISLQ